MNQDTLTVGESSDSKTKIERLQANLAKINGAPSGVVPRSELEAVSNRVLRNGYMETLCSDLFPNGSISPKGNYWQVGKVWVHVRDGKDVLTLNSIFALASKMADSSIGTIQNAGILSMARILYCFG
jgi:hypothetical protein